MLNKFLNVVILEKLLKQYSGLNVVFLAENLKSYEIYVTITRNILIFIGSYKTIL